MTPPRAFSKVALTVEALETHAQSSLSCFGKPLLKSVCMTVSVWFGKSKTANSTLVGSICFRSDDIIRRSRQSMQVCSTRAS